MPLEFFENTQGTPSVTPIDGGFVQVGYCGASDVCSLNRARLLGIGQNPTLVDVQTYIVMTSGQIDGVLLNKGYNVPVNTASFPEAEGLLSWVNATGAAALLEESSPNPRQDTVDRLKSAYDNALEMLSNARLALDVPVDQARAKPRAPGITFQPDGRYYDPALQYGQTGDGISSLNAFGDRRKPYFVRNLQFERPPGWIYLV